MELKRDLQPTGRSLDCPWVLRVLPTCWSLQPTSTDANLAACVERGEQNVAQSGQTRRAEDARREAGESHAQSRSGAQASLPKLLLLQLPPLLLLLLRPPSLMPTGSHASS